MTVVRETIRVAHILSGEGIAGVENYVYNLVSSTPAFEVKPLVICTAQGSIAQKFAAANIETEIIPIRGYFDLKAILALSKFFESHQVDLVHVHLGLDSFVGTIAAKLVSKPVIMSVHFDQPNYVKYSPLARRTWNACQVLKNKSIAHFLPSTQNVASELMRREAVSQAKTTVVNPGIPISEINRSCRERVRTELGASENDVVVIGVGRLEAEKNFQCLIDAIGTISESQKLKVWIVGEGSQRKELEEAISRLNLQETISLLGYRNDIKDLLVSADMFVLPSKFDAFGMSAVEAMMAELPVIGTIETGLSTVVSANVTGFLVPVDDADALASSIKKLAADSNLRSSFAHAGREKAVSAFSSDKMAESIVNVYHAVLSSTRKTVQSC